VCFFFFFFFSRFVKNFICPPLGKANEVFICVTPGAGQTVRALIPCRVTPVEPGPPAETEGVKMPAVVTVVVTAPVSTMEHSTMASMTSTVATSMASTMATSMTTTSVTEGRSSSYCSESKEKRELHFRLVVKVLKNRSEEVYNEKKKLKEQSCSVTVVPCVSSSKPHASTR